MQTRHPSLHLKVPTRPAAAEQTEEGKEASDPSQEDGMSETMKKIKESGKIIWGTNGFFSL